MNKRLKLLVKKHGNIYFRYMPMTHGVTLPQPYTLFVAIKEILTNTNRPATRGIRKNFLFDLTNNGGSGGGNEPEICKLLEKNNETDNFEYANDNNDDDDDDDLTDPLSNFNIDIMKCSRELIIQGIKDFEIMFTIFKILETVLDESD